MQSENGKSVHGATEQIQAVLINNSVKNYSNRDLIYL